MGKTSTSIKPSKMIRAFLWKSGIPGVVIFKWELQLSLMMSPEVGVGNYLLDENPQSRVRLHRAWGNQHDTAATLLIIPEEQSSSPTVWIAESARIPVSEIPTMSSLVYPRFLI